MSIPMPTKDILRITALAAAIALGCAVTEREPDRAALRAGSLSPAPVETVTLPKAAAHKA